MNVQAAVQRATACYELEVVPGLEEIVIQELRARLGSQVAVQRASTRYAETSVLAVTYAGHANQLLTLHTVLAVYLVNHFAVPRPSALLGDQNWRKLRQLVTRVQRMQPTQAFTTLGLSAAGADSPVMRRLQDQLTSQIKLPVVAAENADLLLRLRPASIPAGGWEVLIRLSPRPLSVRPWRVADVKGALNATVAAAMVRLTQPRPTDCFVNLCCGSGTLLIERLSYGPAQRVIGYDIDSAMLKQARANLTASHQLARVELVQQDASKLPLPDASVDALCADPPFGIAIGGHAENTTFYPALFAEAARVARAGARFVVITQEIRLLEKLLQATSAWRLLEVLPLQLRGLRPRIFVLERG